MHDILVAVVEGPSRIMRLGRTHLILGRGATCELAFPEDNGLSRQHLTIEPEGEDWVVRDLGSKNGTFLNGEKLEGKHYLKFGDRVTASRVTITFGVPDAGEKTVVFDAAHTHAADQTTISTTLKEALARQSAAVQALIRAGTEFSRRRPLFEMFADILTLALDTVGAERGLLMVLEDDQLVARAMRGADFRISSTVRDRVLKDHSSLLIQSVREDQVLQAQQSIVLQGVQSLMAVPLQTEDRIIGLLYVDSQAVWCRFTPDDLNLLTVMANVAAMGIERERLVAVEEAERRHVQELAQAAEIQRRHLPSRPPAWEGLEIAGDQIPSRTVGGDYYDYLQMADGRRLMIVADVAGKGMPASLLMMTVQARSQALSETCATVEEFAQRLNQSLLASCPPNRFVTAIVCAVDVASGNLAFVNAGHNCGLLIRADGVVETLDSSSPFLGLIPHIAFKESATLFSPGDLLILYSDGITESENKDNEEFGVERLIEWVKARRQESLPALLQSLYQELTIWRGGGLAADDQTVVLARRIP